MAAVVLNALAEAELLEHFQIKSGALLDTLRLDELALIIEMPHPLDELGLDRIDRPHHRFARCHVMATGIQGESRNLLPHPPGQRVEQREGRNLVIGKFDSNRKFGMLRREHVNRIAADPKRPAPKIGVVALVLHRNETAQQVALGHRVANPQASHHRVVVGWIPDPVNTAHRADNDRIAALQQTLGRRQPHLLDMLVDRRVFLDKEIALRNVGFRLVIVVIGDEVLNRVFRKKLTHLRVELCRERLVRGKDQRRPTALRDDIRHRESLARPRHAQERLEG